MTDTTIALDDADINALKYHAEVVLGLEVKPANNGSQIRAKILAAAPATTHVAIVAPAPAATYAPIIPQPAALDLAPTPPDAPAMAYSVNTPQADPKVTLTITRNIDPARSKDATFGVNGFISRAQRGQMITIPYRAYLALENGIEKRAVISDRENGFGMPEYDYEEVHSYPFTVHEMPPAAEIAAWDKALNDETLRLAAERLAAMRPA